MCEFEPYIEIDRVDQAIEFLKGFDGAVSWCNPWVCVQIQHALGWHYSVTWVYSGAHVPDLEKIVGGRVYAIVGRDL